MKKIAKGLDGEIFQEGNIITKRFHQKKSFDREKILKDLSHPFLIKPLQIDEKNSEIQYPFSGHKLSPCGDIKKVLKMLYQISDVGAYIDSMCYYYTDYSPNNILQNGDDYVLIDFGNVSKYEEERYYAPRNFIEKAKSLGVTKSTDIPFRPTLFLLFSAMWYFGGTLNPPGEPILKKIYDWTFKNRPSILGFRNYLFNCLKEIKNFAVIDKYHLAIVHDQIEKTSLAKLFPEWVAKDYTKNYQYR